MRYIVLLAVVGLATAANRVSYEGFKVYRLSPSNQAELDFLNTLAEEEEYDFWSHGRSIGIDVDVMVSPNKQVQFDELLQQSSIKQEIIIQNVERVVQNERIAQNRASIVPNGQITFKKYHSLLEIKRYINRLPNDYPQIVKLHTAGLSFLRDELNVIQISTDHSANKPVIFIDGGIHAKEWIGPAAVLYIVQELVENPANRYLLEHFDWHIIPLVNPDGYNYSQFIERFWKKNVASIPGSKCKGVDINRNFDDHWGGLGAITDPCSDIYIGKSPFSEPESVMLQKYILSIKDKAKLYLSFHNYGQKILHPWAYGPELPEDAADLKHLGDLAAAAIKSVYNTSYTVGSYFEILGPAAGASYDWAKSVAGIKYTYIIELPGGGSNGYDLPPSEIEKVVVETFEGVKAYHKYLAENI